MSKRRNSFNVTLAVLMAVISTAYATKQLPSVSVDYAASRNFKHSKLKRENVDQLQLKWSQNITGFALCPPVEDRQLNAVYVTDFSGYVYAFDKYEGTQLWKTFLPDALGSPGLFSRTPPVIIGEHLWMGTNSKIYNPFATPAPKPAAIPFILNRRTGQLVHQMASVDDHPGSIFTGSPTYIEEADMLVWGVSSNEETFAYYTDASGTPYECCTFSGSFVGIKVSERSVQWKIYTTTFPTQLVGSRPLGYPGVILPFSGVAVWASGPSVDVDKGLVYFGTGNNYLVPDILHSCVNNVTESCADAPNQGTCVASGSLSCYNLYQIEQNLAETLVVVNYITGEIVYKRRITNELGYTIGCYRPIPFANCPQLPGNDQDFGQANMLMMGGNPKRPVISMNQKGGMTYTLDASSYNIIYANQTVVGGVTGGHQWGSAFKGHIVYTTGSNSLAKPDKLLDGTTTTLGTIMAYDAKKDKWLWKVPDPAGIPTYSRPMGAVAYANGVVFTTTNAGHAYAFDADDGTLLWNVNVHGSSIVAGPTLGVRGLWINTGYQYLNLVPSENPRVSYYEVAP